MNSNILLWFVLFLFVLYIAYNSLALSTHTENFEMYMPNHNPFRNYFKKDFYKGNKVDWKPSLPYNHLTPEYQSHYHQWDRDCLNIEKGKPWLTNNNYQLHALPDISAVNF